MSSYLEKKWNWTVNTVKGFTNEPNVDVFTWENDTTTHIIGSTDNAGKISTLMREVHYKIDNTDDITVTNKTPHTLSICKYGLTPKGLTVGFVASRVDTFFMEDNAYISENDIAIVGGYTGIAIDHTAQVIAITEAHTVNELYDYLQREMGINPVKEYPSGIMITTNGNDYTLGYDLKLDGASLSGVGKYIDMHTKELILVDNGNTSARVLDKNGLQVTLEFAFTVNPNIVGYEWRMYDISGAGSLAGAVEFAGEETSTASNQAYLYKHNGDRNIAVQILSDDYEEYVGYYVLGINNQNIIIGLDVDNND